jgi:hypothetical protein
MLSRGRLKYPKGMEMFEQVASMVLDGEQGTKALSYDGTRIAVRGETLAWHSGRRRFSVVQPQTGKKFTARNKAADTIAAAVEFLGYKVVRVPNA